jgi:alpha-glucoside transport system substrate-binding protein
MRNRNWWAIAVSTVIIAAACSNGAASPAPATAPAATTTASHAAATATAGSQATATAGTQATASAGAGASASAPASTPGASFNALPATPTGYTELDAALGSDQPYKGKAVDIQVQWTGGELANFQASVAPLAKASGITINVDSVPSSHETVLKSRIEGGSPPDIAQLAQPTPVLAYAAEGKVIDLAGYLGTDGVKKLNTEHPSTIGLVTQGSNIWGVPYKADVKSTVWYPIKAFQAAGYEVPKTWDDLIALSDKIVAAGSSPWCVSAGGPGDATGWQLTDWIEEIVLKTKGLDYYNQWINHTVKFEDPGIKSALDDYAAKIFFTSGYVVNGYQSIVQQDQKTTMDPMFNQDLSAPGCWMQKIPTWYGPDFFPDQRVSGQPSKYVVGQDVGIFAFPTIDASQNNVEGSADTMMQLTDNAATNGAAVRAVEEWFAIPEGLQAWILAGSAISTNNATPSDWYAGSYKLAVASQIANNAAGIGFDASDLMPGAVGAGTFWTDMDSWVNGGGQNPTTDDTLKAIDDSWPSS